MVEANGHEETIRSGRKGSGRSERKDPEAERVRARGWRRGSGQGPPSSVTPARTRGGSDGAPAQAGDRTWRYVRIANGRVRGMRCWST